VVGWGEGRNLRRLVCKWMLGVPLTSITRHCLPSHPLICYVTLCQRNVRLHRLDAQRHVTSTVWLRCVQLLCSCPDILWADRTQHNPVYGMLPYGMYLVLLTQASRHRSPSTCEVCRAMRYLCPVSDLIASNWNLLQILPHAFVTQWN
jgi:hypothetical protein